MDRAAGRIALRGISVRYGRTLALEGITGAFSGGSLTAIVGANGAGKSTLLSAIAGTVPLAAGAVERPPRRHLAYLPQLSALDRDFPVTVGELIALGGWGEFGALRAPPVAVRARAAAAAVAVGLGERLRRPLAALSVGELQRALFARLIVQDAGVILLDEPFAAVDAATRALLLAQMLRWHAEGRTMIAVLHDLDLVAAHFPETLVLARRVLAWGPTPGSLPALAA